jgi:membrane protease YdiL (CAAX protease family)
MSIRLACELAFVAVLDFLFVYASSTQSFWSPLSRQALFSLYRFLVAFSYIVNGAQLERVNNVIYASSLSVTRFVVVVLVGVAVSVFISLMASRRNRRQQPSGSALSNQTVLFTCFLLPVLEELFFRGILLCLDGSNVIMVSISCVWFVVNHDSPLWGVRLLRALVYCMCALNGSVWSACVVHCTINLIAAFAFGDTL